MNPGIYENITNDDYHAGPGMSSSALKQINRSPLHYKHIYLDGNRQQATASMTLGTIVHAIVLENGKLPEDFYVVDCSTRNTKIYKQAVDDNPGKTLILSSELETATTVAAAVLNHDKAQLFLSGSRNEVSIYWQESNALMKCRPDAWRQDIASVGDLKTAQSASPDDFQRAIIKYGYDLSAAWYMRGIKAVTGERPRTWAWIVVETTEPYAVQVYAAEQALIERGNRLCNEALARLAECRATGKWPAYSDHILPITCPAWAA